MSTSRALLVHAAFAALAFAATLAPPAAAQDKAPNFNKLDDALQERLSEQPRSRSLRSGPDSDQQPAPPAPAPRNRDDFHWVKPKAAPDRKSDVDEPHVPGVPSFAIAGASGFPLPGLLPRAPAGWPRLAQASEGQGAQVSPQGSPQGTGTATDAPADTAPAAAPAAPRAAKPASSVPVARKNSYVILIKPDVLKKSDGGATDVIKLLEKYGLEPVRSRRHRSVVAPSGRIVVRQTEDALEATPRSALPAPTGKPEIDVRKQLEPDIIRRLRKEGIVDDAYVNSTIRNNTLPRPLRTRARLQNRTFGWIWTVPPELAGTPEAGQGGQGVSPEEPIADGNWGLKTLRVPAMWTIIKRYRDQGKSTVRPKVAVIDQGFNAVPSLSYAIIDPPPLGASAAKGDACEASHGTHVAGIIAATAKNDVGIDGIVPEATIDAVPFQLDYALEEQGAEEEEWMRRWVLFADVMNDTEDYIYRSVGSERPLRVVNLSLAYNLGGLFTKDPGSVPELVRHIQAQAKDVQRTVRRYEDSVLFVVAAGNDSAQRDKPIDAKWASPLAWAGTQSWASSSASPNILVVEALDRSGKRAEFSNVGGHLAAPGVDIMSTLGPGESTFGICSGTSQAAPHVAAVATLLFELDPKRKPKEIADILRRTALPSGDKSTAPRLDALEAVIRVYPEAVRMLADLNGDGLVDEQDLAIFQQQLDEVYDNRLNGTAFTADLNGDGVVDNQECNWPLADLNGSGAVSLDPRDARPLLGGRRTDVEILQLAWSKGKDDFQRAIAGTSLATALSATSAPPTPPATGLIETSALADSIAPNACR